MWLAGQCPLGDRVYAGLSRGLARMGSSLCYRKSLSYDRKEKGNLSPPPPPKKPHKNKSLNPSFIPSFPPLSALPPPTPSCLQLSWQLEEGAEKCIPVSTFNCLAPPASLFSFSKSRNSELLWVLHSLFLTMCRRWYAEVSNGIEVINTVAFWNLLCSNRFSYKAPFGLGPQPFCFILLLWWSLASGSVWAEAIRRMCYTEVFFFFLF